MQARGFLTVLLVAGGMAAGCSSSSATPAPMDYPLQGEAATAAPAASAFTDGGAAFVGPMFGAISVLPPEGLNLAPFSWPIAPDGFG